MLFCHHLCCRRTPSALGSVPGNLGAQYEQSSSAWMGATLGEFRFCSGLCPWACPLERKQVLLYPIFSWRWTWRRFLKHREAPMATCVSDLFAAVPVFHIVLYFNSMPETFWYQTTVFVGYWFYREDFHTRNHYRNDLYIHYSKSCFNFHAGLKLCLQFPYLVLTANISYILYTVVQWRKADF